MYFSWRNQKSTGICSPVYADIEFFKIQHLHNELCAKFHLKGNMNQLSAAAARWQAIAQLPVQRVGRPPCTGYPYVQLSESVFLNVYGVW